MARTCRGLIDVQDRNECPHPPSSLLSVPACFGFGDACAAAKWCPIGRFSGQRLVQSGDGQASIAERGATTAGFLAGGVQRVDDGIENAAAVVPPSCCMKGHRNPDIVAASGADGGFHRAPVIRNRALWLAVCGRGVSSFEATKAATAWATRVAR